MVSSPDPTEDDKGHPVDHSNWNGDLTNADFQREATKADIEAHFATHGTGEITEIKLMNGFGFIEYKDAMDARDVVPGKSRLFPRENTT
jgi:hypothetical protein